RSAINDCYLTHIFDDLRFGVGREGWLALVGECRRSADTSAAGTLGVFHCGGRCSHRSARGPADPARPADAGRQGCRMCGLHRPTTCGTVREGRGVIHARALRRRNTATGRSVSIDPGGAVPAGAGRARQILPQQIRGKVICPASRQREGQVALGTGEGPSAAGGREWAGVLRAAAAEHAEGFFADPVYGGNRDMAGWKMIGYPGARYDYRDWVERHNERYPLPPVSIGGRPDWVRKSG